MLVTAAPGTVLAVVLRRLLKVRGVKPVPAIVLTIVAWCVITVAILLAIGGVSAVFAH
jgi:hypothetical protein